MKHPMKLGLIAAALSMGSFGASAAVEIYNKDGMTFSADGLVNVFYVNSDIEVTDASGVKSDRSQSRVRMGFLPNNVGLNFGKQLDGLKVEMRSSFWVSINDTDNSRDASPADLGTGSLIDVRQFYAKVSGDFGSILLGKDFGLFNRSNILGDELLLGYGQTLDAFGLVDGGNVSFGNISTGYTYPFPKAQITYRSPDINGFAVAIGIMDPNKLSATSSEDTPRVEFEATYSHDMFKAWVNGASQSSKEEQSASQDQSGLGYGINVKFNGFSATASGYSSEGMGHVAGLDHIVGAEVNESEGYLLQASYTMGTHRFVVSSGETENSVAGVTGHTSFENFALGYFNTIRPGVTIVAEFNNTEMSSSGTVAGEDNATFSIGTVVTF